MRIEELNYHSPSTLEEASRMAATLEGAKIIAGGTDVLADLKQGLIKAGNLISLADIEGLKVIEEKTGEIWIGALATPNMLADSPLLHEKFAALSDAGSSMAGLQIRNLATIGGNLCSAVPSADLPPSLLSVEAEAHLVSAGGERRVPLKDFFKGPRQTVRNAGEIMTAVVVPKLPDSTGTAYEKFQLRDASALAVVGCAARLTFKGGKGGKGGKIEKAAVAVGAAAPTPLVINAAGEYLAGKSASEENFAEAGAIAAKTVEPISDIRGSDQYRREVTAVLTRRALTRALERV